MTSIYIPMECWYTAECCVEGWSYLEVYWFGLVIVLFVVSWHSIEDLVDMQSRLDILKTRKSKEWNRYESQTWGQIIVVSWSLLIRPCDSSFRCFLTFHWYIYACHLLIPRSNIPHCWLSSPPQIPRPVKQISHPLDRHTLRFSWSLLIRPCDSSFRCFLTFHWYIYACHLLIPHCVIIWI
jgi:hypothetical protein